MAVFLMLHPSPTSSNEHEKVQLEATSLLVCSAGEDSAELTQLCAGFPQPISQEAELMLQQGCCCNTGNRRVLFQCFPSKSS